MPCGGPESLDILRYRVVSFTVLVMWNCSFEVAGNRVSLKPGLWGVRDVASGIIAH